MGAREFTDEAERERRRGLVRRIGDAAFGAKIGHRKEQGEEAARDQSRGTWHADFARAIVQATGREIGRARVAQWLIETETAKPVPAWVVAALPAIARAAAADLRERAHRLDGLAVESGSPPEDRSEPEPEPAGEPPQESGPAAAQAAEEEDFDVDALVRVVCSTTSPYARPPEPPLARVGWHSDVADAYAPRVRVPPPTPVVPDEGAFLG